MFGPGASNCSGHHAVVMTDVALVYPLDGSPARVIVPPAGHLWDIVYAGDEEVALVMLTAGPRLPIEVRFYRYDSLPLL